ncbi:MAG: DUF4382 domain-containing protein [Chitinophagales bacterium]
MKTKCLLIAIFSLPVFFSCKKKEVKTSPVEFYLMDSPASYDAVNIHIKKIEAKIVSDSTVWLPIHTKDTVVNLLNFQDSATLMMAHDIVPFGLLKEIRFILGGDNTVVVNGVSHPLLLPGSGFPELMIDVNKKLNQAFNGFILDFDAAQSIVADSVSFRLQPVIRLLQ